MHTDVLYLFYIIGIKYPRSIISSVSKHALIKKLWGRGKGCGPKYFLVHMTMSTGPLASPLTRGGDSRRLQIFA